MGRPLRSALPVGHPEPRDPDSLRRRARLPAHAPRGADRDPEQVLLQGLPALLSHHVPQLNDQKHAQRIVSAPNFCASLVTLTRFRSVEFCYYSPFERALHFIHFMSVAKRSFIAKSHQRIRVGGKRANAFLCKINPSAVFRILAAHKNDHTACLLIRLLYDDAEI